MAFFLQGGTDWIRKSDLQFMNTDLWIRQETLFGEISLYWRMKMTMLFFGQTFIGMRRVGERLWYAAFTVMMKNDSGALSNSLITCFWSLSYLPSDWNQTGDGKGFPEWLWALPAAGLRPSEACNVRRPDSVLGAGMRFEMRDGQIVNVIIDLREEKNLRSDLINVSGIKKPREQKVYPACFFRNMQSARIFYIFFHSNLKRVSWAFQVWRSEKHFERYITCCLWTYFLSFDILWENILSACGKVGWNKADYHIRQS